MVVVASRDQALVHRHHCIAVQLDSDTRDWKKANYKGKCVYEWSENVQGKIRSLGALKDCDCDCIALHDDPTRTDGSLKHNFELVGC